ncbi:hypothetical protein ACFRCW_45630 [Streptomyces sp. NPDC056653]
MVSSRQLVVGEPTALGSPALDPTVSGTATGSWGAPTGAVTIAYTRSVAL